MVLTGWMLSAAIALAPAAGPPPAAAADCQVDHAAMLALPLEAFDQDMEGGWRALDNRGCSREAAELIAAYRQTPANVGQNLLAWHEAQIRAELGQTAEAVALMRQSYRPAENNKAGWNLYVDGSIAFLQGDRPALQQARDALAVLPPPEGITVVEGHFMLKDGEREHRIAWPPNLNVLDGLLRCFGQPYGEAYGSQACRTPKK